jgi:hypothetical protein
MTQPTHINNVPCKFRKILGGKLMCIFTPSNDISRPQLYMAREKALERPEVSAVTFMGDNPHIKEI